MPSPYRLIHERLMHPANAKPDTGIHMNNGWPMRTNVVPMQPQPQPQPQPSTYRPPPARPADFWASVPWECDLKIPGLAGPALAPPMGVASVRFTTISAIIRAVVQVCSVSAHQLKSGRRDFPLTLWRQVGCALSCRLTHQTTTEIGRRFGNRDHTTVLHAERKLESHMDAVAAVIGDDASPVEWVRAMKRRLEGGEAP